VGELSGLTTKTTKTTKERRSRPILFFAVFLSSWFGIFLKGLP